MNQSRRDDRPARLSTFVHYRQVSAPRPLPDEVLELIGRRRGFTLILLVCCLYLTVNCNRLPIHDVNGSGQTCLKQSF